MGADVVLLTQRRRAGPPGVLPDPTPFVTAEVRDLIDQSRLALADIAAAINQACRTVWVDQYLVERWYRGEAIPRATHMRVLLWLAGDDLPAAGPRPAR